MFSLFKENDRIFSIAEDKSMVRAFDDYVRQSKYSSMNVDLLRKQRNTDLLKTDSFLKNRCEKAVEVYKDMANMDNLAITFDELDKIKS